MNQTKLDELISKWENNFKKVNGPGLPLEEWSAYWAINEFIKDLKSLKSERTLDTAFDLVSRLCPDGYVVEIRKKTTQSEQEVEIKKANVEYYKQYKDEGEEGWAGLCTCDYFVCSEEKYCGNCGKKIKWID